MSHASLNVGLGLLGALGLVGATAALLRRRPGAKVLPLLSLCLAVAFVGAPAVAVLIDARGASASGKGQFLPFPNFIDPGAVGSAAPDFALPRLSDGKMVHLHDLVGRRPVVLVFGSFSCDLFCTRLDRLRDMYERFGGKAEFLFVYTRNALHPLPAVLRDALQQEGRTADSPEGRRVLARTGMNAFHFPIPCVMDGEHGWVCDDYAAFPQRLLILDRAGRIALDSGRGLPGGLNLRPAAEWLGRSR
jgi:hypothetical protein